MAVAFAPEPVGSRAALAAGLSALGGAASPSTAAHFAAAANAQAAPPLPVHNFSLGDLNAGRDPRSEPPTTWKYLLVCGGQATQTANVASSPGGGFEFAAISSADAVAINNAVEVAENDPETARQNYELRLAEVPALYVTALWLKSQTANQDRFVIVPPAPDGFSAFSILSAADFLQQLQAAAQRRRRATLQQTGAFPTN